MNNKNLTLIALGIIFLSAIASAQGNITDLVVNQPLSDVVAGEATSINFSFNYPSSSGTYPEQIPNAPLVLVVNISSNSSDYPMWKHDFELNGNMIMHPSGIFAQNYEISCTEEPHTIHYLFGNVEITNIPNGTFYCTNSDLLKMAMDSENDVVLNFKPNPAIWPGTYFVSIGLFYPPITGTGLNNTIYSPQPIIYNERKIRFNITTSEVVSKMEFLNLADSRPRWARLCKDCAEYGFSSRKIKMLKEGENNVSIRLTFYNSSTWQEYINLFIDSKDPRITKTLPRRNEWVNTVFKVEFMEDNPTELFLNYGNEITGFRNEELNISDCWEERRRENCEVTIDLSDFDNQEIEYWFNLTDIAGNYDESRSTRIKVDTSSPLINSVNFTIDKRRVSFKIGLTEENLDEVFYSYLDNRGRLREGRLCSTLRYGICEKSKYFSKGEYNMTITARDEAGNFDSEEISFEIE